VRVEDPNRAPSQLDHPDGPDRDLTSGVGLQDWDQPNAENTAATHETLLRGARMIGDEIARFAAGTPPVNVANRTAVGA